MTLTGGEGTLRASSKAMRRHDMTTRTFTGLDRFWTFLRIAPWIGSVGLLILPAVAMQFTDEVQWTAFDFAVAGAMLFICCSLWELGFRLSDSAAYRMGLGIAVGAALVTLWVNGAVGVIGDEDNPANLMFVAVLAMGVAGAFVANFKAAGMARAMTATAAAQALVGVIAFAGRTGSEAGNWMQVIVVFTLVMCTAWMLSAWLFRQAAGDQTRAAD